MLSASGLMGSLQPMFHNMERLNFTPFVMPYTIKKTSKGRLRFESCKKYTGNWIWQFLLIVLVMGFAIYKLLKEATSNVENAMRICHLIGFSTILINIDEQRQKSDTFVSFLNGLLRFETAYLKGKSAAGESKFWMELPVASFAKNTILSFQMSLFPLPILLSICDALLMKSPWFLLPRTLLEDWILPLGDVVSRAITFVFTYSFWSVICNNYLILLALSCTASYCGLSFVNLALGKELHGLQTADDVERFIRKPREAKLICSLYNEVHERRITPSLIVTFVGTVSVYLFVLISEWTRMGLCEVAVCLETSSVAVLGILCCVGLAADVFASGQKVTRSLRHNNGVVQKRLKKYWKSFPTLKVGFGQDNYIDRATPLVVFDFAIDITVNLVLVK